MSIAPSPTRNKSMKPQIHVQKDETDSDDNSGRSSLTDEDDNSDSSIIDDYDESNTDNNDDDDEDNDIFEVISKHEPPKQSLRVSTRSSKVTNINNEVQPKQRNIPKRVSKPLTSSTSVINKKSSVSQSTSSKSTISSLNKLIPSLPLPTTSSSSSSSSQQPLMTRYSIQDHSKIMEDMKNTILSQELAMEDIGSLLREIHSDGGMIHGPNDIRSRIIKRILSGPSGVGKTETIKRLRYYLCMEPGDFNENQFIHIDGSVYKDVTQLNRLTGSGPGYAACDSNHTLVDDLIRAARSPFLSKIQPHIPSSPPDFSDNYNLPNSKRTKSVVDYPPPKFIFLFIDEIDKTHLDFMSIINGLLDEGSMKSSRGSLFVLPKETKLIIIFTSNYGYEKISRMTLKHQQTAIGYVEEAMSAQGLAPNSIERFGTHIIFYPIVGEKLIRVIEKKINTFFSASHPLTKNFGSIDYADAVQCICDFIIRITDPGQGIRNSVKHLHECLTPLLLDAFYKIQELPDEKRLELFSNVDTKSSTPVFNLFKETFHLDTFFGNIQQQQQQQLLIQDQQKKDITTNGKRHNHKNKKNQMVITNNNNNNNNNNNSNTPRHIDIIEAIRRNIKNEANLEVFKSEKQDEIHAFGISKGDYVVNCVIVPLIVKQYTVTQYDTEASKEVIDKLQYDNRCVKNGYIDLKKQYVNIRGAIQKGEVDKFNTILTQEPNLLEFSEDDDENNNTNNNNNNNIIDSNKMNIDNDMIELDNNDIITMEQPKKNKIAKKKTKSIASSSSNTIKRKLTKILLLPEKEKSSGSKKRKVDEVKSIPITNNNNDNTTTTTAATRDGDDIVVIYQKRSYKKQIDGYEYLYSANGRSYYKCLKCGRVDIDKRYITTHICKVNDNSSVCSLSTASDDSGSGVDDGSDN